jgi:tetratricopeptide (TPR) repeat protein
VNRTLTWAAVAALLVATAAAYVPSIDGEFQYDDQEIAKTTWVREGLAMLSPSRWKSVDRPLTAATFALNHAMDGFRPRVWHATNVLVHLAVVVLAWRVARQLLVRAGLAPGGAPTAPDPQPDQGGGKGAGKARKGSPKVVPPLPAPEWVALAAAALFALHPLHTEAVSYISQRSEALASAFYLGGLLVLFAWDRAEPGARRWLLAGAAFSLQLLGLRAKPIAATLPVVWLLAAVALPPTAERDRPWTQRVKWRLLLAAPLVILALVDARKAVVQVAGSGHAGFDLAFVTPLQYVATQIRAFPIYLRLVLWPAGLNADWWFPFSKSLLEPAVLASAALLAALVAGALLAARRYFRERGDVPAAARLGAFGLLFFFAVLAPTTLVPLRDAFVEHRLYLASFGVILAATAAAVAALRRLAPSRAPAAGAALAAAALLALGATTFVRNRVWQSALALWADASEKSPEKPRTWVNLGTALHFAGRYAEAVQAYDRSLALGFDPTVPLELVVRNTALALVRLRRYDEARERLVRYLKTSPRDAATIVILALVEVDTDRLEDAERTARKALAIDPRMSRPFQILGQVHEKRGDLQGALDQYANAARLDPADPLPVFSMGRIEEKRGRVAEACGLYARAQDTLARSSAARNAAEAYRRLCARAAR